MPPYQRPVAERALALAREAERTAVGAPDGQALDRCEQFLMRDGRELLRACLGGALQAGIGAAEEKGLPTGPAPAAAAAGTRAVTPRRS
jgi:hypothetical protein